MVFEPNAKLKSKMSMDGNVLKYMYSVAGGGLGLIAGGAVLLFFGVLLAAALYPVLGLKTALKIGVVIVVSSLLLMILGRLLQKHRMDRWSKEYSKSSGFSEEELQVINQEFQQPGTLLLSFSKGKDSNSLKKMGFITAHYVKFPGVSPWIFRLNELVACFYTKQFLCQDGGQMDAFIAYGTDEKRMYMLYDLNEKAAREVVDAVASRNPMVITDHHFMYEGKEYDAVRGMKDVICLYQQVRRQQGE